MARLTLDRGLSADLYPDVVEKGGIAPALRAAAGRVGVDLGEISTPPWPNPFTTAYLSSGRGGIGVVAEPSERRFDIGFSTHGHNWANGSTADMAEVVGAVHAWREGATLRELAARFPFMTYDRMAQAYEDGNPVEVMWDLRLHDPELDAIRPLLRAAHAEPRLRAMFPAVTHLTLAWFSSDPPGVAESSVRVLLSADGDYQVFATWDQVERVAGTPEEAVAQAVSLLPEP